MVRPVRLAAVSMLVLSLLSCASKPSRLAAFEPPRVDPVLLGTPRPTTLPRKARLPAPPRTTTPGSLPLAASPAASPILVEAAAPDASWTVVCEAREDTDGDGALNVRIGPRGELSGDRLQRYLNLPSGESVAIDELVASSADGHSLVVKRAGHYELWNDLTGERRPLPGVESAGDGELPTPSVAAFTDTSLFYLRKSAAQKELVELTLATNAERPLYSDREELAGLELDPTNHYVILSIARRRATTQNPPPCRGPIPEIRAARESSISGFVVVPRAGGKARRVDDLALVFGKELIRRRGDGSLVWDRDGRTRFLADDKCRGRILFAEPTRQLLLLGCEMPKKPWRFEVTLIAGTVRRPLSIDVAGLTIDEPPRPGTRFFPLYPGAETMLFDAERQTLRRFSPGDQILGLTDAHALIRRGRTALLYDAETDRTRELPGKIETLVEVVRTGRMVHASPFVVNLMTGRWVGNVSGRPLALSVTGEVLLAERPASAEALARGPLLWQAPVAAP
jgi:hypothetical protein